MVNVDKFSNKQLPTLISERHLKTGNPWDHLNKLFISQMRNQKPRKCMCYSGPARDRGDPASPLDHKHPIYGGSDDSRSHCFHESLTSNLQGEQLWDISKLNHSWQLKAKFCRRLYDVRILHKGKSFPFTENLFTARHKVIKTLKMLMCASERESRERRK